MTRHPAYPFATATLAGALSGLLVGGVLGRIAMRAIAALSPRGARGLITDDGAVVGAVTLSGSLALAGFCTALGALGGLVYLAIRPALAAWRILGFGLLGLAAGGGLFVHGAASVDFGLLRPQWLSVTLFTLLPAGYGLLAAWLFEVLRGPVQRLPVPAAAVLGVAAFVFPQAMLIGAAVLLAALLVRSVPALHNAVPHRVLVALAGCAAVAVAVLGLVSLVVDVASIVADS